MVLHVFGCRFLTLFAGGPRIMSRELKLQKYVDCRFKRTYLYSCSFPIDLLYLPSIPLLCCAAALAVPGVADVN